MNFVLLILAKLWRLSLHPPREPRLVDVRQRVVGVLRPHDDLLGGLAPPPLPDEGPDDQQQQLGHEEDDRAGDQARIVDAPGAVSGAGGADLDGGKGLLVGRVGVGVVDGVGGGGEQSGGGLAALVVLVHNLENKESGRLSIL